MAVIQLHEPLLGGSSVYETWEVNDILPALQEGEEDSDHIEKHFYLEKCFEQKLVKQCGKEKQCLCVGGVGLVVKQSHVGILLGRMMLKLRRSVMRSYQPSKILEHSDQKEQQVQRP